MDTHTTASVCLPHRFPRRTIYWRRPPPQRCIRPAVRRRRRGGNPPPPLPMFEADCEDFASPPSVPRGLKLQVSLGGGGFQPTPPPSRPPFPPPNTSLPPPSTWQHRAPVGLCAGSAVRKDLGFFFRGPACGCGGGGVTEPVGGLPHGGRGGVTDGGWRMTAGGWGVTGSILFCQDGRIPPPPPRWPWLHGNHSVPSVLSICPQLPLSHDSPEGQPPRTTNHQTPAANRQPPNASRQPPTANRHQPPTADRQPSFNTVSVVLCLVHVLTLKHRASPCWLYEPFVSPLRTALTARVPCRLWDRSRGPSRMRRNHTARDRSAGHSRKQRFAARTDHPQAPERSI